MTAERLLLVVASVGLPRSVLSHYPVEGLDHFEPLALIFAGEEGLLMPLSDDTPLTGLVSVRRAAVQVAPGSHEQVRFGIAGIVEHRGLLPFASSEFPSALCQSAAVLCAPALRPLPFAQALRPHDIRAFRPLPIPKDLATGKTQQLPATRPANAAECSLRQLLSSKGPLVFCTVVSPLCRVIPLLARQSRARQAAQVVGH